MTKPEFQPKLNSSGTWFVAVATGHGPESHIGDFLTKEEAHRWIATKSKFWPGKPDASDPKTSWEPNRRSQKNPPG
jgi:hypothetical protein